MKTRRCSLALAAFLLCTGAVLAGANGTFVAGSRDLDGGLEGKLDDHFAFGLTIDFAGEEWPVRVAVGAHGSLGDDVVGFTEVTAEFFELSGGVVWYPDVSRFLWKSRA